MLPKPDSGHADTISLTIRVRRATQKRHETQDPVRSHMKRSVKLLLFLCLVYPVI